MFKKIRNLFRTDEEKFNLYWSGIGQHQAAQLSLHLRVPIDEIKLLYKLLFFLEEDQALFAVICPTHNEVLLKKHDIFAQIGTVYEKKIWHCPICYQPAQFDSKEKGIFSWE